MLKRVLLAILTVAALFAAAYALRIALFRAEPPAATAAAPAPQPAAAVPVTARVAKIGGMVERRAAAADTWSPIALGDTLIAEDTVRTGSGASAELAIGKGAQVEVAERSEFRVGELSEGLSQVRLEGGRIRARVQGGGSSTLRVEVKDSDAVVEAKSGSFAMLRGGDAQVTVVTNEGVVDLTAHRQRVRVEEGEQSVVLAGQPPSAPSKIPPTLFLKISRDAPRRSSKPNAQIGGETAPGALVRVNGETVSVGPDGRFTADVSLAEGRNEVTVTAEDALGRTEEQKLAPITVDTRAPDLKGRVVW